MADFSKCCTNYGTEKFAWINFVFDVLFLYILFCGTCLRSHGEKMKMIFFLWIWIHIKMLYAFFWRLTATTTTTITIEINALRFIFDLFSFAECYTAMGATDSHIMWSWPTISPATFIRRWPLDHRSKY